MAAIVLGNSANNRAAAVARRVEVPLFAVASMKHSQDFGNARDYIPRVSVCDTVCRNAFTTILWSTS